MVKMNYRYLHISKGSPFQLNEAAQKCTFLDLGLRKLQEKDFLPIDITFNVICIYIALELWGSRE